MILRTPQIHSGLPQQAGAEGFTVALKVIQPEHHQNLWTELEKGVLQYALKS